jgi:hypothetical protein
MVNTMTTVTDQRKFLRLSISIFCAVFLWTTCDAQSIVGKWKGVSVKNYYSPEYAKQIGKSMDEKTAKDVGNSEITYNVDHTFIMNISTPNSAEVMIMNGRWESTGDQLKLTLEPKYNPQKMTTTANYIIHGNTIEITSIMAPPSRIAKSVAIGIRI